MPGARWPGHRAQWRKLRKDHDGALADDPGVGRTETLHRANGTDPTFFV